MQLSFPDFVDLSYPYQSRNSLIDRLFPHPNSIVSNDSETKCMKVRDNCEQYIHANLQWILV